MEKQSGSDMVKAATGVRAIFDFNFSFAGSGLTPCANTLSPLVKARNRHGVLKLQELDHPLFTALRWSPRIDIDVAKWPNIKAYMDRVAARPKLQEALEAEGLQ
jgi:hypothetical protein